MQQIDHHIQRQIIETLAGHERLRFRDLKPDGMENNIFTYHLQNLIGEGLIAKNETEYMLTADGLTYVDQLSFTNLRPRLQPKVIAILVVETADSVALLQRHLQPYLNQYMLPSGKLHFGEPQLAHAQRELQEKLGLQGTLQLRGVVTIGIAEKKTITHVVAHVFSLTLNTEVAITCSDKRFTCQWIDKNHVADLTSLPGTQELIDLIDSKKDLFIEDFAFDLPL